MKRISHIQQKTLPKGQRDAVQAEDMTVAIDFHDEKLTLA
jgi:hypothetical protein